MRCGPPQEFRPHRGIGRSRAELVPMELGRFRARVIAANECVLGRDYATAASRRRVATDPSSASTAESSSFAVSPCRTRDCRVNHGRVWPAGTKPKPHPRVSTRARPPRRISKPGTRSTPEYRVASRGMRCLPFRLYIVPAARYAEHRRRSLVPVGADRNHPTGVRLPGPAHTKSQTRLRSPGARRRHPWSAIGIDLEVSAFGK